MQCDYQKRCFDTNEMAAFPTGNEHMPRIYVSVDRTCFLETYHKHWEGPRIRFLNRGEALRFAKLYRIEGLREILTLAPAVAGADNLVAGLTSFRAELTRGHRDGGSTLEDVRMLKAIDSVCRTEGEKVSKARWANPFTRMPFVPQEMLESKGIALRPACEKSTVAG